MTAVGTTFEKYAYDKEIDSVFLFHTPWSAKSKKFMPIFEQLAQFFFDNHPTIRLFLFDTSSNEHLGVHGDKIPVIKMHPIDALATHEFNYLKKPENETPYEFEPVKEWILKNAPSLDEYYMKKKAKKAKKDE